MATQRCRLLPLNLCVPWRGQTEASPQVVEKPGAPRLPCSLSTGGCPLESQPETESWRLVSTQGPRGRVPQRSARRFGSRGTLTFGCLGLPGSNSHSGSPPPAPTWTWAQSPSCVAEAAAALSAQARGCRGWPWTQASEPGRTSENQLRLQPSRPSEKVSQSVDGQTHERVDAAPRRTCPRSRRAAPPEVSRHPRYNGCRTGGGRPWGAGSRHGGPTWFWGLCHSTPSL